MSTTAEQENIKHNNNINTPAPHFQAAIINQVVTLYPEENIIISPLLLEAALALLYLGSDGHTAEQLRVILQLQRFGTNAKMANFYADILEVFSRKEETTIHMLQRILLAEGVAISDEFQKIALKYFFTTAENGKVHNGLELLQQLKNNLKKSPPFDKIVAKMSDNLMATLTKESRAVLLNAVSFQSKWFLPFSAYRSGTYDFHLSPEQQQTVPMMFDDDMFVKFAEFKELDARAIELPYEHEEELAMLLILPNRRDGLSDLEQRLSGIDLCDLDERMQMESVQVLLPKFTIDCELNLKETLEKLGINSLFSKEANLSNLLRESSKEGLAISDVLHKVSIDVNESGSEATTIAAHKPIVISNSIDTRHKFFRADHPFYFVIRSRDVILFAGHVTKC